MASFDETIEKAVQDRDIPGIVLLAKDKSGSHHDPIYTDMSSPLSLTS